MRHLLCLSLFWTIFNGTLAYSEEQHDVHNPDIDHVEITLPKSLLSGFEVIDESLTMRKAIQIGLVKNLDIQVADYENDYRQSLWQASKAERWPTLNAGSFSFLRTSNSGFLRTPGTISRVVSDDTYSQEFSLYAKMPLYTGGRIRAGIKASRYAFESSEEDLKDMALETAFKIRESYLSALLNKTGHHIHKQHKNVQEELLRLARIKYKHGKGLKADVLHLQAEVAGAQENLNTHHNNLNKTLFDLKAVMGIDLGSDISLSETLRLEKWDGETLSVLIEKSLTEHPKVLAARKQLEEAKLQTKLVRSQYFPQVYGQVSGNVRLPENKPELGTGVVGLLTASWSIVDRERDHSLKASKIQYLKSEKKLKNLEIQLAKEIAQTWSEMEFSEKNVYLSKTAIDEAQEDLRLTQRRFEVGRALNVEVQDSILTLLQAQLDNAKAIFTHELAKAKLMRMTGAIFY